MKNQRLLEKKLWSVVKEIFIFVAFLVVMYSVAYSNVSEYSYNYNKLFLNTFVISQSPNESSLGDVSVWSSLSHSFSNFTLK